jgi:hypothetical protein
MVEGTPWSSISPLRFLRDVALNAGTAETAGDPLGMAARLTVCHRPDVATRLWWTLTWVGDDGKRHSEAAQDLALLMRRAAAREMAARAAWGAEAEDGR